MSICRPWQHFRSLSIIMVVIRQNCGDNFIIIRSSRPFFLYFRIIEKFRLQCFLVNIVDRSPDAFCIFSAISRIGYAAYEQHRYTD